MQVGALRPIPGMARWQASYSGTGEIPEFGSISGFQPENPNI